MSKLSTVELEFRKDLARKILASGTTKLDEVNYVDFELLKSELSLTANLNIPFPEGLKPVPKAINPKPLPSQALPIVDIVIVTWTVAENDALADVLTPGYNRNTWYRYDRFFSEKYVPQIRPGAPSRGNNRLGSYFITSIGEKKVLCFKSELHLNQDGIRNYNGTDQTSLPVRLLFKQIIEETKCSHIFTVGTCGGIKLEHDLGDVLVTRSAKFRFGQEFENAPFNNKSYKSNWEIPEKYFPLAENIMSQFSNNLKDPVFGPPTKRHAGENWTLNKEWIPNIIHENATGVKKIPLFHPILTTDYFEFGHSNNANELWSEGCGVEMGDAVLGLVCENDIVNPPKWLVIRNLSDPQINGDLTSSPRILNMQAHWAVWYYECYGYWTSVMSSITTWGVIAGL